MTETPTQSGRPSLTTKNTFDAPALVGRVTKNGTAALRPGQPSEGSAEYESKTIPDLDDLNHLDGSATSTPSSSAAMTDEEIEDYDRLKLDPDTIIDGSVGGDLDNRMSRSTSDIRNLPADSGPHGFIRRKSDSYGRKPTPVARRRSFQIRLEKTDKKGRYVLTADDPEIQDILRRGLEREAASMDPSKRSRTIRDYVFTRQWTTFDRQNPLSSESPFHGFFTLFWLAMVLMFVRVCMINWREYGSVLGRNEVMKLMFSRDIVVLGLTDGAMCLATSFGFFLHKLIVRDYLSWNRTGWIIQNIWQTFFLAAAVGWTVYRDWPWTHTTFIVLHAVVFLMKQHSYSFYNGYLSGVYRRRNMVRRKMKHLHDMASLASPPTSPAPTPSSSTGLQLDGTAQSGSLKRRPSMGPRNSTDLGNEKSDVAHVAAAMETGKALNSSQMQSFERIMQDELNTLDKELQGKSTSAAQAYPNNLTIGNFADWVFLPTLVYELEYPRQERINWMYVLEKTVATFGVLGVMQVISQAYIYPPVAETVRMKEAGLSLEERWYELPWIISDMLFPLLLEQLLTWYLIWVSGTSAVFCGYVDADGFCAQECMLNVLAELTRFADRGFYGDWWNSVSWDQYARDWNRPVHNFLLRHVYHSSISAFHLSKSSATFVTFLLSALVHELVMACLFKKVRGYLFTMQLLQIPLVTLSRTKLLKGRNTVGNVVFWIGLFVGPSVLTSFYLLI
ncbi:hypothetical protein MBLNU459_g5944t2 [Dothideomycetes sp. NU459]